jgi:hypothetical protein
MAVTVILADLSGSMDQTVGFSGRTRRDVLAEALKNINTKYPDALIYAFGSTVERVYEPQQGLPPTMGGTDLAGALAHLRALTPKVTRLVVISDGQPDSIEMALTEALLLMCEIGTIYCGDETNKKAIRFLRDLAACTRSGLISGGAKVVSLAALKDATEEILRLVGPGAAAKS